MKKILFVCSKDDLIQNGYDEYLIPESQYLCSDIDMRDNKKVKILDAESDKIDYMEKHRYVYQYRKNIIRDVYSSFNEALDVSFNEKQWDFVLGQLISTVIFSLIIKYERVSCNSNTQVEFVDHNITIPKRFFDVAIASDEYNAYLYSLICSHMKMKPNERSEKKLLQKQADPIVIKWNDKLHKLSKWKTYLTRMKNIAFDFIMIHLSCYKFFGFKRKSVSLCARTFINDNLLKKLIKQSKGKIDQLNTEYYNLFYKPVQETTHINMDLRNKLFSKMEINSEIDLIVKDALIKIMPMEVIEEFGRNYKEAKKLTEIYYTKKIYTAAYLCNYSVVHTLFAAIKRGEGTELVAVQHGDLYIANKLTSFYEMQTFDRFITSGWKAESEYCEVTPVKEQKYGFSQTRLSVEKKTDINKILLIAGEAFPYEYGMGTSCNTYYARHFEFVSNLDDRLREKLVVRFRGSFSNMEDKYRKEFPNVCIHHSCDYAFEEDLNDADIVICDYRSSPFFQSILKNKPTLLFDGIIYYVTNEAMDREILDIEKMGLYRKNGADLAILLNNSISAIYDIWQSDETQKLMNRMLCNLLRIDSDSELVWYKELAN